MSHRPPIRVRVSLPAPLLACGVAAVLLQQPGLQVEQRPDADASGCDLLITDHAGGLDVLGQWPGARVLVITGSGRERDVCLALRRGVQGYLMHDCSADELVAAVHRVVTGGRAICSLAAQRLAESLARETLTAREQQVLELLVRGLPNKAIARALSLAIGTVQSHTKAVLAKLGASSRTEAVSIAHERGLLPADAVSVA